MRCLILLHSTTGNTRLVTRYARRFLRERGIQCDLHVLRKDAEPPSLEGVDLLGVAFPVMYFQPTMAMTALVEALEPSRRGLPAFVLSTAAGDPGAALHMMVEQLERKGMIPLQAHWVICPSNYPLHRGPLEALAKFRPTRPMHRLSARVARRLWRLWPNIRPVAGLIYDGAMVPQEGDRQWLDTFLDQVLERQRDAEAGRPVPRPDLARHTHSVMVRSGLATPLDKAVGIINLSCDASHCNTCGLCEAVCPTGCVTTDQAGVPHFGTGCTGCYACYNACEYGALSAVGTPKGTGRYAGPPPEMKQLFGPRRV
jgi:ferredoxin/flavodoxin